MESNRKVRAATSTQSVNRMDSPTKTALVVSWICRVIAAVILLQTLFFKFSGAEESVYIFSKIGLEPWGRYASGVVELAAAILLLTPCWAWLGAMLSLGVISGALISHVTVLGIAVRGDHGLLFGLAVAVFITSAVTLFLHRHQVPVVAQLLKSHRL